MNTKEKVAVTDEVSMELGSITVKPHEANPVRTHTDKVQLRANVHLQLVGPDGTVKYEEHGENLLTDHGDNMIAARIYDDTQNIVTGMRLGTGNTAAAKNGAGAAIVTYITGSQKSLDAPATDATKGAGLGWRTTYVCTYVAGDVTNGAIAEIVLTDETPLTDVAGAEANTVARYVLGATIDKQAADSLVATWKIDILGA